MWTTSSRATGSTRNGENDLITDSTDGKKQIREIHVIRGKKTDQFAFARKSAVCERLRMTRYERGDYLSFSALDALNFAITSSNFFS